jgi:CubicO group peptidase (beta-lactamase class C family)
VRSPRLGCLASVILSFPGGIRNAADAVAQNAPPVDQQKDTFAGRSPHPLDGQRVAVMNAFVAKAMKDLGVPGVGFALIDHGKIVLDGGVGVRKLDKPEPVDAHTLFMIGSNTKGMSTLLLARLVDEGKLDWDEPRIASRVRQGGPRCPSNRCDTTIQARVDQFPQCVSAPGGSLGNI